MPTVKLVFDIDEDLRNRFKSQVALAGGTIKDVLTEMIEDYLQDRRQGPKKGEAPRSPRRARG